MLTTDRNVLDKDNDYNLLLSTYRLVGLQSKEPPCQNGPTAACMQVKRPSHCTFRLNIYEYRPTAQCIWTSYVHDE